jgi:hypothetical protein
VVQSLHIEVMPPVFISTGSPREKVYAWMSLMASDDPVNSVHPVQPGYSFSAAPGFNTIWIIKIQIFSKKKS